MKLKYIYSLIVAVVAFMFTACSPEEYKLGSRDVTPDELLEGIAFSIEYDATNPNIIYLKNKMESKYKPQWFHPQGRSQENVVTLKIAFPGTYDVVFGVQTNGGVVLGETVQFTVEDFCAEFVNHELWMLLSGGIGESKTWYLDLNAAGECRYFVGPLYFYGVDDSWATVTEGKTVEGDSWSWTADWAGNGSWLFGSAGAADFGSMTFDLIDGANIVVEHNVLGRTDRGSYMLDTDNYTMKLTDAAPLHDRGRDGVVLQWGEIKLLSLTESSMQLGVIRDNDPREGPCLLVYNYISKDYYDNWTPAEVAEPEPLLPDNWQNDISQTVSKTIAWTLSELNPFDFAHLDGSRMNNWNMPGDYPDWVTGAAGRPLDPSVYAGFSMTLDSDAKTVKFITPNGTETNTTYNLDEKGIYTFGDAVPEFAMQGSAWRFKAGASGELRVLSIEKNAIGSVTGIWLGAYDPAKSEYMAYHLIPNISGGASDPLAAIKRMFAAKTWKLDSNRTYSNELIPGSVTIEGPVVFSDMATWCWNPMPGEHYASGDAGTDYGTMKFNEDGSVVVKQLVREKDSGGSVISEETKELNGTWTLDLENNKLNMSVGMLHPWTCNFAVADWGDVTIYRLEEELLLLQVMRSRELTNEDAMLLLYVFVPE